MHDMASRALSTNGCEAFRTSQELEEPIHLAFGNLLLLEKRQAQNHSFFAQLTYLNMNDVAEDRFLKALSEVVDRVAKSLDEAVLAFMGKAR
jgi:hypothetical protein